MRKIKKNCKEKENNNNEDNISKIYFGYGTRLVITIVLFIISLSCGLLFLMKSFNFVEQKKINYNENSSLDYKVYLKDNDFYDQDYLGKNMLYVANLIEKINVNFDYSFISDKNINLNFDYNIIGRLVIADSNGKSSYFEKDYILLKDKKISMNNDIIQNINENIDIDYDYYNSLANKFKTTYGVETSSKLILYLVINKNGIDGSDTIVINNKSEMILEIPLSEKAIEIEMDYKEIDTSSSLFSKSNIIIDNIIYMVIAVILVIFSIVVAIKVIRLLMLLKDNTSKYDKYIKRLLVEYDRLIVETTTCPIIDGDNVIKIEKFNELLDVRDNLKLPIMYYIVNKHHKCYFYITYENKIYLYIVKAIDLENK